jgi:hypothetical protein
MLRADQEAITRKVFTISAVALALSGAATITARADEVAGWNQTLFRSVIIAGTSPLNTTRVNALVQAAVFDAVNGIDRRYTPTDAMLGVTRQFHGVSEVLEKINNARIFAGIHFRTATEHGMALGAAVADHVLTNTFQRVN